MDMNRRQFFRVSSAGLVGSSLVAMGFSPTAALAQTRNFKLARTTETRSTCPYCSVSCGLVLYTLGDRAKNVKSTIVHVEGDPDHPVNRGTLCPKGAGVMDMIQSKERVLNPQVREAGSRDGVEDDLLGRGAHACGQAHEGRPRCRPRQDRREGRQDDHGQPLEHQRDPGQQSASSNESGYLSVKVARGLGMVALDTQARI